MFGNGNHYEQMVKKNQWDQISKKINKANAATKIEIAQACSNSSEDESMNILIRFLTDNDVAVQLEAVKSLGICGRQNTKTHLHWLGEHLPEGSEQIKEEIKKSLATISSRH